MKINQDITGTIERKLAEYIEFCSAGTNRTLEELSDFVRQLNSDLTHEQKEILRQKIMAPTTMQSIREIRECPTITCR